MKQKTTDGWEYDALGNRSWYNWKPGQLRYIKNKMNRRVRKESKKIIEEELSMRCENCDIEMESLGYGDEQCPECGHTTYAESEEDFNKRIYGEPCD